MPGGEPVQGGSRTTPRSVARASAAMMGMIFGFGAVMLSVRVMYLTQDVAGVLGLAFRMGGLVVALIGVAYMAYSARMAIADPTSVPPLPAHAPPSRSGTATASAATNPKRRSAHSRDAALVGWILGVILGAACLAWLWFAEIVKRSGGPQYDAFVFAAPIFLAAFLYVLYCTNVLFEGRDDALG